MKKMLLTICVALMFFGSACSPAPQNSTTAPTPPRSTLEPITPSEPATGYDLTDTNIETVINQIAPVATPEDGATEKMISRYYGTLGQGTENSLCTYDIKTLQTDVKKYTIDLSFYEYSTENLVQHITYEIRDDFRPDTIRQGIQIQDVNQDGNDDVIMELGIYGPLGLSACFLYSVEQQSYIVLPSFDELVYPQYNSNEGVFVSEYPPDSISPVFRRDKYKIENDELVLTAILTWEYLGDTPPVYAEQYVIDGNMVTVKEGVPENDIDMVSWMFSAQYIKAKAASHDAAFAF